MPIVIPPHPGLDQRAIRAWLEELMQQDSNAEALSAQRSWLGI